MPSYCLKDNRLQVTAYVKLRLQKNLFCIFVNGSFFISFCVLIIAFPIQFWFSLEKFYALNYIQFVWNVFELHMFPISNVAIHIHFVRGCWIIWYWANILLHSKWIKSPQQRNKNIYWVTNSIITQNDFTYFKIMIWWYENDSMAQKYDNKCMFIQIWNSMYITSLCFKDQ